MFNQRLNQKIILIAILVFSFLSTTKTFAKDQCEQNGGECIDFLSTKFKTPQEQCTIRQGYFYKYDATIPCLYCATCPVRICCRYDATIPTPTAKPKPTLTPKPTAIKIPTLKPTSIPPPPTFIPTGVPTQIPTPTPTIKPVVVDNDIVINYQIEYHCPRELDQCLKKIAKGKACSKCFKKANNNLCCWDCKSL